MPVILRDINGGTTLPQLANPATAAQIRSGYQAIDANGEVLTGTLTLKTTATTYTGGTLNTSGRMVQVTKAITNNTASGASVTLRSATPSSTSDVIVKYITSTSVTGTYATDTYYNVDFGVQIGYISNTDIVVMMRGGKSSTYEHLQLLMGAIPSGVTIVSGESTDFWMEANDSKGYLYATVFRGFDINKTYTLEVDMSHRDADVDAIIAEVNITEK